MKMGDGFLINFMEIERHILQEAIIKFSVHDLVDGDINSPCSSYKTVCCYCSNNDNISQ